MIRDKFLDNFARSRAVQIPSPMKFLALAKHPVFQQYLDASKSTIHTHVCRFIKIGKKIKTLTFIMLISRSKSCKHDGTALVFNFFTATNLGSHCSFPKYSKVPLYTSP